MTDNKARHRPSEQFPWFASDPSDGETYYFATEQGAIAQAKEFIDRHMEDGWDDEVDQIIVGKITHHTVKTNVTHRPKREDFSSDEDFQDACGEYPNMDFNYCCNYEPLPLSEKGEP